MYLPTKSNWEIRKLEVWLLILDLAKEHRSKTCHNDGMHISTRNSLLHAIIDGPDQSLGYSSAVEDFIVDNCLLDMKLQQSLPLGA